MNYWWKRHHKHTHTRIPPPHTHEHTLIHLQVTLIWHRANQSLICPFSAKRLARKQPPQPQDWTRDLPKAGRTFWQLSYRSSYVVSNTWRRKEWRTNFNLFVYKLAHEPKYIVSRLSIAPDPWTCTCICTWLYLFIQQGGGIGVLRPFSTT